MLTSIRTNFSRGIARWVLIALVALLAASFGIWGIQDVFRGFRSDEVLSVGSTTVSQRDYQRVWTLQVRQASRQFGKILSPSEARLLGLDRQVLARVSGEAALDEQSKRYGLDLDQAKVASAIMADPTFRGASGQFDRNYFNGLLRDNGYTEAGFLDQQRKVYLRGQIGDAVTGGAAAPAVLREAFARYRDETRSVAYVTLTDAAAGDVGQPDAAALKTYYDEHKSDFRTAELRKVTYLALLPDALAAGIAVSDDDAKAEYEARKDRYVTPEKRTIQQIAFPDAASAKAAADRIAAGTATFEAVAAERKIAPADLDLGTFTKAQMLDPLVADAAFALAQGAVSGPVAGRLSNVVLRVPAIEPEIVKPLDEVKAQIKTDLALARARQQLLDRQAKIEDERAGGASLKEIAAKLGLATAEVPAMDAQGRDASGASLTLPLGDRLAPAVFAAEPGSDADPVDGRDEGLVWFSVDAVTPARDRTPEEARDAVLAGWKAQETARRVKAKAEELLAALRGGKTLDAAAGDAKLEVKEAWTLKRNAPAQGLSSAAVSQIFGTPVKGFATALADNGTDRFVIEVRESIVPPFDARSADALALGQQLDRALAQDLLAEYLAKLQSDLGLTVNSVNLNRAVGAGEG